MLTALFQYATGPLTERNLKVREKACVSLLKLAATRAYAPFFTPERFFALGCWLEGVKDAEAIRHFVAKVSQFIQQRQLPFKYCCVFVVFVPPRHV